MFVWFGKKFGLTHAKFVQFGIFGVQLLKVGLHRGKLHQEEKVATYFLKFALVIIYLLKG